MMLHLSLVMMKKSVDKYIDTYMGENGLMYDYLQNRHKMFVENMKIWLFKTQNCTILMLLPEIYCIRDIYNTLFFGEIV